MEAPVWKPGSWVLLCCVDWNGLMLLTAVHQLTLPRMLTAPQEEMCWSLYIRFRKRHWDLEISRGERGLMTRNQIPLAFLCSKWIVIKPGLSPSISDWQKLLGEHVQEHMRRNCWLWHLAGEPEPLLGNHQMAPGEIMFKCSFFPPFSF